MPSATSRTGAGNTLQPGDSVLDDRQQAVEHQREQRRQRSEPDHRHRDRQHRRGRKGLADRGERVDDGAEITPGRPRHEHAQADANDRRDQARQHRPAQHGREASSRKLTRLVDRRLDARKGPRENRPQPWHQQAPAPTSSSATQSIGLPRTTGEPIDQGRYSGLAHGHLTRSASATVPARPAVRPSDRQALGVARDHLRERVPQWQIGVDRLALRRPRLAADGRQPSALPAA